MVNTLMIGKLVAVRRVEIGMFVDGNWDNEVPQVELTVMSTSPDLDGQPNFSMTKEFLDAKLFSKFNSLAGKFVAIPYMLDTKKDKQVWKFDDSMPILELKDDFTNFIKPNTDKK
ncbi:MAG: hypothetical protein ACI8WT_003134 [Clostridium sp.]|jgi:hypothetical protein